METVRNRTRRETETPGASWPAGPPAFVTLTSGVYQETVPAGQTVSELREQHRVGLDLDPNARAVVAGREVGDTYRPKPSEHVVWTKRAGEKG